MFRQIYYDNELNNSLDHRLRNMDNECKYNNIKFWDIKYNAWVDCDNLTNYKIQKEVRIDNDLIFYIYREDYTNGY